MKLGGTLVANTELLRTFDRFVKAIDVFKLHRGNLLQLTSHIDLRGLAKMKNQSPSGLQPSIRGVKKVRVDLQALPLPLLKKLRLLGAKILRFPTGRPETHPV